MDLAGRRPDASSIVAIGGEGVPDRASLVALVSDVERQHGDALLGFVHRLRIDDDLAEDLVQEALLRLYDEMLSGTSIEDPRAWIFTVIYRLAMNEHRRRSRWRHLLFRTGAIKSGGANPANAGDPVSVSERRMVWGEVDRLPERQRAVLYLRYRADLPFDAIGGVLGITASAARSHATQAIGTLRLRLAGEEGH